MLGIPAWRWLPIDCSFFFFLCSSFFSLSAFLLVPFMSVHYSHSSRYNQLPGVNTSNFQLQLQIRFSISLSELLIRQQLAFDPQFLNLRPRSPLGLALWIFGSLNHYGMPPREPRDIPYPARRCSDTRTDVSLGFPWSCIILIPHRSNFGNYASF